MVTYSKQYFSKLTRKIVNDNNLNIYNLTCNDEMIGKMKDMKMNMKSINHNHKN